MHLLAGVTRLKLQPAGCLNALDAGAADPEVPEAYCSRVPASPPAGLDSHELYLPGARLDACTAHRYSRGVHPMAAAAVNIPGLKP